MLLFDFYKKNHVFSRARNINNTLIYTQLVDFQDDDYPVKIAGNVEEDKELIEAGFEYVTDRDCLKIYRKRK